MSPDLLRRTEMKSKAGAQCGSAPRDPPENGQAGRAKQQRCCAQRRKFLCSGQKPFVQPSPLRGRCRRSRRMRCSAPARLCRQMLHFASLTEISRLHRRQEPLFLSRRKKKREKERPLRGFRREVSPDLLRRTEIKRKAGAQCGSAPRDPPRNGQAG